MAEYEPVIGLEVHVQLKTKSKMFTRAAYQYGEAPNVFTNPVVMGLPGALPVLNKEAIEQTVRVGLMFGSKIADICKWDRKNYFYPDNPKNYQISQYDQPLCEGGEVEIELPGSARNIMGEHRTVKLTRAHLEEDVGKLTHVENDSLVDYNRAGVPLLEIVSEPDLFNTDEVVAFLNALRVALSNAGVSDCDMEKGQLRCDANVSLKLKGSDKLGTRTEMKNLNSVSNVKNAIEYEIKRQTEVLDSGGSVTQETRRWNVEGGFSTPLRGKEEAHDYRYFPDPDLMPVKVPAEVIERITSELPEMPFDMQRRYIDDMGLPYTITSVICLDKPLSDYFEAALKICNKPKQVANYIANDLLRELSAAEGEGEGSLPISESPIKPKHIGELAKLVDDGTISSQVAKEIFPEMFTTGKAPTAIVEEKGLKQDNDMGAIEGICIEIIAKNPKPVAQYKEGKQQAINPLMGQVMKATQGKANPKAVSELLRKLIDAG